MKELFQGKKKGGRRGFFSLLCNIGHDGAPQDERPEEEGTLVRVLLSLPLSLYALSLPSLIIVLSRGQRFRSPNFTFLTLLGKQIRPTSIDLDENECAIVVKYQVQYVQFPGTDSERVVDRKDGLKR